MQNLKIEYIKIEKLTPYKNNSKIHTKEQIKHIVNSIEKFGFNDPLGICGENNLVLEGNGRIEAAKLLKMGILPCVRLDHLNEDEQRAYVITHNALNLETGFDEKAQLQELESLQKKFDMSQFGLPTFDQSELKILDMQDDYYIDFLSRHKQKLVRNQFQIVGKYGIPLIRRQEIDLEKIDLINFNNTKLKKDKNNYKTVQFFTHDYKFDYVYSHPELAIEKLKQYYCLLSPDYSLYTDMPLAIQIKNTFKNRWCGAYFQSLGLKVIPTIEWSNEQSFEFCFDGVEEGSVVAVSTYGKSKIKEEYLKGYNEMLRKIKPCAIICYEKPFPEMNGKIKVFPYNHNEWTALQGGTK